MNPSGRQPPHLSLLIAMTAVGPLALNIFMPSMPGMMSVFDTDYGTVQLTLTLYLAAMAVAQLFVGALGDRFGRRPVVLSGLTLFLVGTLACIFAPNMETVVLGRVIQAVGACAGLVMSRAILRDLYGRDRAASMMAYMVMAMVVAPMLAPSLGGVLDAAFGWRAGFVAVFGFAAAVLLLALPLLGETHGGPFRADGLGRMFLGFAGLVGNPVFLRHALQISFSSAAFFAFLGGAPYVMLELLGRTSTEYGFYFIIGGFSYMCGNFVAGRLTQRLGTERMITLGTSFGLAGGGLLTSFHLAGWLTAESLFGSMALIALGNGMCLPAGTAGAVSADPSRIGAAAGLSGFMQMAAGALASYVVGILLADTATPLVALMATAVVIAAIINAVGRRIAIRAPSGGEA